MLVKHNAIPDRTIPKRPLITLQPDHKTETIVARERKESLGSGWEGEFYFEGIPHKLKKVNLSIRTTYFLHVHHVDKG